MLCQPVLLMFLSLFYRNIKILIFSMGWGLADLKRQQECASLDSFIGYVMLFIIFYLFEGTPTHTFDIDIPIKSTI